MRFRRFITIATPTVTLCTLVAACNRGRIAEPPVVGEARATVFVDVSVLPMTRDTLLEHQTVVVSGSRIERMGPAGSTRVPAGAIRIDGRGLYLMPGLADMHAHARYPEDLTLYLAYGVTTIFNQSQPITDTAMALRRHVEAGRLDGPRMLGTGIRIDGPREAPSGPGIVRTASEARAEVRRQYDDGFRYVKVYSFLQREPYVAATQEARRLGMTIVGHLAWSMNLDGSLVAGQRMISHAEEYLRSHPSGARGSYGEGGVDSVAITLDRSEIPWMVRLTRESGAYVCTTLSTAENIMTMWGRKEGLDSAIAIPEARFVRPEWRSRWAATRYVVQRSPMLPRVEYQRVLVKELFRAGVPLLLGTDSPGNPSMVPGYSLHNDIRALMRAGIPLYSALEAGTRNAGRFVAATQPVAPAFGTVEQGMAADLILLRADPRRDVANLSQRAGVMARGRWYAATTLDSMLEAQAARLAGRPR